MASLKDFDDLLNDSQNHDEDLVTPQIALEIVQRAKRLRVEVLGIDLFRLVEDGKIQPDMGDSIYFDDAEIKSFPEGAEGLWDRYEEYVQSWIGAKNVYMEVVLGF